MRVTKFVHSCLLVETDDRVALFDPGIYSWESGLFNIEEIENIDRVLITHEHPDHLHLPFIKAVKSKFPMSKIITNESITKLLAKEGIPSQFEPTDCSICFDTPHNDRLPWADSIPQNIGFHFKNQLTYPGDSISFTETRDILALPITAPWGSMGEAVAHAIKLRPKIVIPIHDWHWSDVARKSSYSNAEKAFSEADISFIAIENGQAVDLG